jgi:hypothetical protein
MFITEIKEGQDEDTEENLVQERCLKEDMEE